LTVPDDPSAPTSAGRLLVHPSFGPFFWGNLLSNSGLWFHNIAAAVVVFNLTGSALLVGLVSVLLFLFTLLLGPWAGALTDRVDRRRLMLGGQLTACAGATTLAGWTLAAGADGLPGAWPVLAATGVIGLGYAFSIPAMQALVPALVDPVDLDGAIALNSVTFNLARAVGPALAAAVLVAFGPGVAFAVNAMSYLGLITALLLIRPRMVETTGRGDGSVRAGLRYVLDRPDVVVLLAATAGIGFAADPVNTLTPPLAAELGGGDGLVGALVSAFGVGAVVGTTVAPRFGRRFGQVRVGTAGLALLALAMATLGAARTVGQAVTVLVVGGFGYLLAITGITTALQRSIDEGVRGRVMALWGMAFLGSRPLAAVLDGAVADAVSTAAGLLVAAGMGLLGVVLLLSRRTRAAARPT
jgi:MFS family permease